MPAIQALSVDDAPKLYNMKEDVGRHADSDVMSVMIRDREDTEVYAQLFARYDLDRTGIIETMENLSFLTLNTVTRFNLDVKASFIDLHVKKKWSAMEETNEWLTLQKYILWFKNSFINGAQASTTDA